MALKSFSTKTFCALFVAVFLSPVKALTQTVSYSFSGTIEATTGNNAVDIYGYFGPAGANLAGDSFTISFSYNPSDFGPPQPCGYASDCNVFFGLMTETRTAPELALTFSVNGISYTTFSDGSNPFYIAKIILDDSQKLISLGASSNGSSQGVLNYFTSSKSPILVSPGGPLASKLVSFVYQGVFPGPVELSGAVNPIPCQPGPSICFEGQNIAGLPAQTVAIGQKLELSGIPVPDANQEMPWTILGNGNDPNNPVGGFKLTADAFGHENGVGRKLDVALNNDTTTLYWTSPGTYQLIYTPTVGGASYSATFNVVGPTATDSPAPPGLIQVTKLPYKFRGLTVDLDALTCGFPGDATKCAQFNVMGSGQGGVYKWVQKILRDNDISRERGSRVIEKCFTSPGLDSEYPLEPLIANCGDSQSGAPFAACEGDSPNTFLERGKRAVPFYAFYQRQFKAQMYLMWDPKTPGSILVPLGSTVWSWKGGTRYDEKSGTYTQPTNTIPTIETFQAGNAFPEWSLLLLNDKKDGMTCRPPKN